MQESKIGNPLRLFEINTSGNEVNGINEVGLQQFNSGRGIYRAARVPSNLPEQFKNIIHRDQKFKLNVYRDVDENGRELATRRLYQIYDREVPLFPNKQTTRIGEMEKYPTFLTQCGLIDPNFIKSLFFTQTVNKEGYYKYFVKRNGVYHVETVDDEIPVDSIKQFPIYGLSIESPWQIILLKAWIKEKGGLEQARRAEPFEFLQAFGLPSYKVFNFKKDLKFIQEERVSQESKKSKLKDFKLNKENLVIIGKSRDSAKLNQMGLIQNRAAYRFFPMDGNQIQAEVFRVESTVPHKWVGELSVIADKQMNSKYDTRKYNLSLENSFLIKRKDMLELFNKFYVAPNRNPLSYNSAYFNNTFDNTKSRQISFTVKKEGQASIVIQVPQETRQNQGNGKIRYPKIKYFLAREADPNGPKKSVFKSRHELKSRINLEEEQFVTSEKDKYDYYDIQYGLGYHKSINQFITLQPGEYVMHVKVQKSQKPFQFQVIMNTSASIENFHELNLVQAEKNVLFNSAFYSLGLTNGTEVAINDKKYQESIKIGNLFYEIGYGFIIITTMKSANHHLAMRVFPKRLKQAGYVLKCGNQQKQGNEEVTDGSEKSLVYVSQKGVSEIIVLRMIRKIPLEQRFPPKGAVEFYRVTD